MSQDGLFFFDSNNTAQGGPRLIRVSSANPLPVNTGAAGGTQSVNLSQVGGAPIALGAAITSSSAIPVTIAQDVTMPITGSVIATFGAGSNIIGKVGIDQTTPGTTNGVQLTAGTAIAGKVGIDQTTDGTTNAVHLTAGTNIAGKFGIDQTTAGTTNAVVLTPAAGGQGMLSLLQYVANNTTPIQVKSSAGTLYQVSAYNNSGNIAYIHFYNSTSPVTGTTTVVDQMMIPAPPSGGGGGVIWSSAIGTAYSTGIAFSVTSGFANTDATAPAANTYTVTCYYK